MLLARENGGLKVFAETYTLEFATDRPFVHLDDAYGNRICDFFVLSSIHPLDGRDDTTDIGAWEAEQHQEEIVLTLEASSSVWQSKLYRFRCQPARFSYEVEVAGQGHIAEALYFGGYYSAQIRWGSGFFWSGQAFQQGFNPEPNCDEVHTFPTASSSTINLTGVPLPGKDDWFFTPPPFCYAMETGQGWMSMAVEAQPGANQFTEYHYHGARRAFHLSLSYEGYTRVDGRCRLPALAFQFGPDPYTLLAGHVHHLRSAGLAPIPARGPRPAWWSEPIFCGWGAQCHLAASRGGHAPDYATQASYDAFLHTLAVRDLHPGTLVLDDKWQAAYGENAADTDKWPDLPGFIRARHQAGQRVLLWLKAWSPEGVPLDECITNAAGLPAAVDPTNPAFQQRLRASVRRMLSADGYDADGFKIDFSARIPSGPGFRLHGGAWGLELMRLYLDIIYEEAHTVKPDALVIAHTPHPYLAASLDAIRLNDINTGHDVPRQMIHRARVASIACPEALIDMDNWPVADKAAWLQYLDLRPFLGIPALYYASHIDSTGEPLTEDDYDHIRAMWAEYRAGLYHRRPAGEKVSELGGSFLPEGSEMVKRLTLSNTLPVATKPLKGWGADLHPWKEHSL
jgi:hypothetical protein